MHAHSQLGTNSLSLTHGLSSVHRIICLCSLAGNSAKTGGSAPVGQIGVCASPPLSPIPIADFEPTFANFALRKRAGEAWRASAGSATTTSAEKPLAKRAAQNGELLSGCSVLINH